MALQKATLTNAVTGERITVQFNPEQYVLTRQNNYAEIAIHGLAAPLLQFVHGALSRLTLELFIDTLEAHVDGSRIVNQRGEDARPLVRRITSLMDIDPSTHAPPPVIFTWGSLDFTAVLAQADQTYTLFGDDGRPLRARIQATFAELTNPEIEGKATKRETVDYTKRHLVVGAETLPIIAAREYGRARLWRVIAAANGLDDPKELRAGQRLRLPRLPFVDPQTGEEFS